MNMNPNDIKKALEFCTNRTVSCVGCPFEKDNFCGRKILQGSLAYIDRLEAEVEKLEKENSQLRNEVEYLLTNRLLGEDKTTVMAMCCETLEKIRQDMQIVEIKRTIQDLKIAMESDRDFDDIMNGTRRGDEE